MNKENRWNLVAYRNIRDPRKTSHLGYLKLVQVFFEDGGGFNTVMGNRQNQCAEKTYKFVI